MGSVSIAEMERVALGTDDDIGNVIELGDLNDDLGMNLLMNPSKMPAVSVAPAMDTGRTVNINSFAPPPPAPSSSGGLAGIEISPLEPLEPISLDGDAFGGSMPEIKVNRAESSGSGFMGSLFGNGQTSTASPVSLTPPAHAVDPAVEKKEKTEYLNKLQRLEQKGFPVSRKFTMDNSLDEIKTEFFRLVDARQLETSLKFQRQMLVGAITGMEWLNGRFDPFDVKLEGWSESVHENIEDFDEIFEELYDKYKDRGKMSPEVRLLMAVAGSGFMCHVSNSFFRQKMPSMDDVLRNNPQLARQMAAAAAQQAGPGFGNLMGAALGMPPAGGPPMPAPTSGYPANGGPVPSGPTRSAATADTGAFYGASAATPLTPVPQPPVVPQVARREMAGPSGVDDILRTCEEVRRAEAAAASIPQPATGFMTQPAVAAAVSAASVVSAEELQSIAESARTGATATGRRRKRAQPPVGNTVTLNV